MDSWQVFSQKQYLAFLVQHMVGTVLVLRDRATVLGRKEVVLGVEISAVFFEMEHCFGLSG